jgi:4-amino-4-deoxy-L-arabinose transferase-like glycosyltransferase
MSRAGHYLVLCCAGLALFFWNLGAPSLWDVDEGHNAEAAREMREAESWVVPTFNFQLRPDKPALLYWLQIGAYRRFGVNEFGARFPSAMAALGAVLLTYELGRSLFGAATGVLAGLVLATSAQFCGSAHFANPDALLNALTALTLLLVWHGLKPAGPRWLVLAGASAGLAVLTKGPVGIVLPLAVAGLFALLTGRWRELMSRYMVAAAAVFLLVALPWYVLVGVETRLDFLRGFFLTHNLGRFKATMEGHGGPVYYYLVCLLVGLVPWSVFLGPVLWHAGQSTRDDRAPACFLWVWVGVYFVFFSLSATKLPNYTLPAFPPLAVLTARFLERWRTGELRVASGHWRLSLANLVVVGVAVGLGLLMVGGSLPAPFLRGRQLPGLERGAPLGLVPVLGAVGAWCCLRGGRRTGFVLSVAVTATVFVGALAAWGAVAVDAFKAPRALITTIPGRSVERDIRVGCYQYYQPSLVFYCQREVLRCADEPAALELLGCPLEAYLFVPTPVWDTLRAQCRGPVRVLTRHRDLYQNREIVLVTNR